MPSRYIITLSENFYYIIGNLIYYIIGKFLLHRDVLHYRLIFITLSGCITLSGVITLYVVTHVSSAHNSCILFLNFKLFLVYPCRADNL